MLVTLAFAAGGGASAEEGSRWRGQWQVVVDNDTFFGDGQYTSGVQIAWRSGAGETPGWLRGTARWLEELNGGGSTRQWGLAVGQSLFTPDSVLRCPPDPTDRPYAGWLYGALGAAAHRADRLTVLEVQAGVVGPSALGEQTQNTWHKVLGELQACGWDGQLRDEPGLNVVLSHLRRFHWPVAAGKPHGLAVGVGPGFTVSVGNVQTFAGTGVQVRLGQGLDGDFGPAMIGPSLSSQGFGESMRGGGWYVFAALEGRVVGRDVTLDGSTFRASPSVAKRWLVGDFRAGIAVQFSRGSCAASIARRSREFETQRKATTFFSLLASLRY